MTRNTTSTQLCQREQRTQDDAHRRAHTHSSSRKTGAFKDRGGRETFRIPLCLLLNFKPWEYIPYPQNKKRKLEEKKTSSPLTLPSHLPNYGEGSIWVTFRTQIKFPFPCGLTDCMPLAQGLRLTVNPPTMAASHLQAPMCSSIQWAAIWPATTPPWPYPCPQTRAEPGAHWQFLRLCIHNERAPAEGREALPRLAIHPFSWGFQELFKTVF